jgi:dTMP kinase
VFIAFEGGEGSGKSTQVDLLASALIGDGWDVVVTREPGATEVGARIRSLLLDRQSAGGPAGVVLTPRAEALLYAADRAHHVASVVRPALANGSIVISDRYIDSSLAYQGAGRTLPVEEVSWLSTWATGGLRPDLVVLLDIDPDVGLARVTDRGATDRLESEANPFHERVRFAFLDLASKDPRRYLVVDANGAPEAVAAQVAERVRALLPDDSDDHDPSDALPEHHSLGVDVPSPPPMSNVDASAELPVRTGHDHEHRAQQQRPAPRSTVFNVDIPQ